MMKRLFLVAEGWLRIEHILYAFWSAFWTLNGLDKFFIPQRVYGPDGAQRFVGWFGTARDEAFIAYFARLDLPAELALTVLYTFAVIEVIIGLTFLWLLIFRHTSKIVHRLAFKSAMLMFLCFSIGDIFFGDRRELWEHGTFMLLALVTWQTYVERHVVRGEIISEAGGRVPASDVAVSTVQFDKFLSEEVWKKMEELEKTREGD